MTFDDWCNTKKTFWTELSDQGRKDCEDAWNSAISEAVQVLVDDPESLLSGCTSWVYGSTVEQVKKLYHHKEF